MKCEQKQEKQFLDGQQLEQLPQVCGFQFREKEKLEKKQGCFMGKLTACIKWKNLGWK